MDHAQTIISESDQSILRLISDLHTLITDNNPLINCITYPTVLIAALHELRSMVEMDNIKISIVDQIKFLLANNARQKSKFEGHMLHTVISGNPGTGKTTIGRIIAKIWMALGFVSAKPPPATDELVQLKYQHGIANRKLDGLRELLDIYHPIFGDVRRKIYGLKRKLETKDNVVNEWNSLFASVDSLKTGFNTIIKNVCDVPNYNPAETILEPNYVVATRADLIAEYLGQTAPKTRKILESARGGVLFIDEAYSICNIDGETRDKYGEECLTTINEYMSLYPNEIIIIFAGYKDKMLNTIFKAQPGLLRRCTYFFEIKDYTPRGLGLIFKSQLAKHGWTLDPTINITAFFEKQKDYLAEEGGFTEKLAFFCKISYGINRFDQAISGTVQHDSLITEPILHAAMDKLKLSSLARSIDTTPHHMYV